MNGRLENIRVFFRDDLLERYKSLSVNEIKFEHLHVDTIKKFQTEPFIIFIDNDGSSHLIKNRYGNPGVVNPKTEKERFKELLNRATKWETELTNFERTEISVSDAKKRLVERLMDEL